MGVIELLTLICVALRLFGVIAWPWPVILLPEYVTIVLYINWLTLQLFRWRHDRRRRKK